MELFYQQSDSKPIKILFAILGVFIFVVIWAKFFAPNASNSLKGWVRWILEFIILILSWVLIFKDNPIYIVITGFDVFVNLLIQATMERFFEPSNR